MFTIKILHIYTLQTLHIIKKYVRRHNVPPKQLHNKLFIHTETLLESVNASAGIN